MYKRSFINNEQICHTSLCHNQHRFKRCAFMDVRDALGFFLYVNLSLKNALIVMSIYLRTLDFILNVMYFISDKSLKLR